MVFIAIIAILSLIYNFYLSNKLNKIKDRKDYLERWNIKIEAMKDKEKTLQASINEKKEFLNYQYEINDDLSKDIECQKNLLSDYQNKIEVCKQNIQDYEGANARHKTDLENDIQNIIDSYLEKEKQLRNTLKGYEQTIQAYIAEEKRKEEMNTKLDFYRLVLTDSEINDVIRLTELCSSISQADILKKLIYKTYFEKKMNDLLGRVIGANSEISGIYKITHIESGKSYIGQSTNIKDRWRTHLKRGLGIDTPVSNKFYSSMQSLKPWNFTWELIEACPKESLNEKEKYWIDFHQSNTWGWNSKGGNK